MPILSRASKDAFNSPVERLLASIANLRQQPTSKGAHFYRTSLRRFQAWTEVVRPRLDFRQEEALTFLDRLRKSTGRLRDSEVHLGLLETMSGVAEPEKKKLERALKSRRNAFEKKLKRLLRDPILRGIWSTLRVLDAASQAAHSAASNSIPEMGNLALDEYRAFVQRRASLSPENLHGYRLECKRFRYIAELSQENGNADVLIEGWKTVQDVIGEWHDYLTLSELAAEVLGDSPVLSALTQLVKKKYAESQREIAALEHKLVGSRSVFVKKPPRRAQSNRRTSRAA
jgi:CHAD domain-containing protein